LGKKKNEGRKKDHVLFSERSREEIPKKAGGDTGLKK